jgi:hypothetical protein
MDDELFCLTVSSVIEICGVIRRTLKGKTKKEIQLKLFYRQLPLSTLMNGSDSWTTNARDKMEQSQ